MKSFTCLAAALVIAVAAGHGKLLKPAPPFNPHGPATSNGGPRSRQLTTKDVSNDMDADTSGLQAPNTSTEVRLQ